MTEWSSACRILRKLQCIVYVLSPNWQIDRLLPLSGHKNWFHQSLHITFWHDHVSHISSVTYHIAFFVFYSRKVVFKQLFCIAKCLKSYRIYLELNGSLHPESRLIHPPQFNLIANCFIWESAAFNGGDFNVYTFCLIYKRNDFLM